MAFAPAWPRAPVARSSTPVALAEESAFRPESVVGTPVAAPVATFFAGDSPAVRFGTPVPLARGMKPEGFPRNSRLLSGVEFKRVFDARQAESNRFFRIHWAGYPAHGDATRRLSGPNGARLGLAIAKRVVHRAVDRNRIRRVARETFRRRRQMLRPADYIVLARPPAADADIPTLTLALEQLWSRFESQ